MAVRIFLNADNTSIILTTDDATPIYKGDYPVGSLNIYCNPVASTLSIFQKGTNIPVLSELYNNIKNETGVAYGATFNTTFLALDALINTSTPTSPITGFATEDNQVNGLQRTKITDGTDDCTITNQSTPGTAATITFIEQQLSAVGSQFTITDPSLGGSPFVITGGTDWTPQGTIAADRAAIIAALNAVVTGWTATPLALTAILMTKNVVGFFAGIGWAFNNVPVVDGFKLEGINNGTDPIPGKIGLDVNVINTPDVNVINTPDVGLIPSSSLGYLLARKTALATINATIVKASPGKVFSINAQHLAGANKYIHLYNKASAPVPAADAALLVAIYPIINGEQTNIDFGGIGVSFSNGIAYTITQGVGDTDATPVVLNSCTLTIAYT